MLPDGRQRFVRQLWRADRWHSRPDMLGLEYAHAAQGLGVGFPLAKRTAVRTGLIGLLLRGRSDDREAVAVALERAGGRPQDIVVLLAVPMVFAHTAMQAGIEPQYLRLEVELQRRDEVRELLAAAGGGTGFPICAVAIPLADTVPRAARRAGCRTVVVADGGRGVLPWSLRAGARIAGVDLALAPARRPQHPAEVDGRSRKEQV